MSELDKKPEVEEDGAQTTELTQDDKTWGLIAHLSAFAGYVFPFGNLIAPIIIWQIKKEESPFASSQAKEALNFQISITIYLIVAAVLCLVFVGFLILPVLIIMNVVLPIIAGIKANNGEFYTYPFTIRLVT